MFALKKQAPFDSWREINCYEYLHLKNHKLTRDTVVIEYGAQEIIHYFQHACSMDLFRRLFAPYGRVLASVKVDPCTLDTLYAHTCC